MRDSAHSDDTPYCRECGYPLVGLTESSKCPECGRAIVEVLVRDSFPGTGGYRYTSPRHLWGLPLIAIASGRRGAERYGRPVGIIAIGDHAKGVIAIGGRAFGVLAIGGFAFGGISIGGLSCGLLAVGGMAAGVLATGGLAIGLYALGSVCFYVFKAIGAKTICLLPW